VISLVAYVTNPEARTKLVTADAARPWLDDTPERFAYRCLPLLIANQGGWLMTNPDPIRVTWNGTAVREGLTIEALDGASPWVSSHFGSAIVTWNLPYLFRTSPGFELLVRGPANWPKDGVCALEGVVETDWAVATFTMNWKLTRPHLPVVFERDEPICMIVPRRAGELEGVVPTIRSLEEAPLLADAFHQWSDSRAHFLAELQQEGSHAQQEGWQRTYMLGLRPDGARASRHRTRLHLRSFTAEKA
jgi:hypothetical protein